MCDKLLALIDDLSGCLFILSSDTQELSLFSSLCSARRRAPGPSFNTSTDS